MESSIISFIVGISIIYCVFTSLKDEGVSSENSERSAGSSKDSIQTLIDRIDWGVNLEGRLHYKSMTFLLSTAITFIIIMITHGHITLNRQFVVILCVVFLLIIAFHNFTDHHMKKNTYTNIDSNIERLRSKLGVSNTVEYMNKIPPKKTTHKQEYKQYKYTI
jgi:hypothetical protein